MSDRPLLTFVVAAYNQEHFVPGAIKGAFEQDYSPLEIILSDDNSKDKTYQLMREMAGAYQGPHRVVLNRNEPNRGLVDHVNRIVELAKGEIIIGSAGDDISLPDRSSLTFQAWEWSGRKATSIHGRWCGIDENGNATGYELKETWPAADQNFLKQPATPSDFLQSRQPHVSGCCHAFSKSIFDQFGPLPSKLTYEDTGMAFRSVLAGEIVFINKPLVKYRRHSDNTYAPLSADSVKNLEQLRAYKRQTIRELQRLVSLYESFENDIETFGKNGKLSGLQAEEMRNIALEKKAQIKGQLIMCSGKTREKLRVMRSLLKNGYPASRIVSRMLPNTLQEAYFMASRSFRG